MGEETTRLNIEQEQETQDTTVNTNRIYLFKLVRELSTACNQNRINFERIKNLKEEYKILGDLEILKKIGEDNGVRLDTTESKICFKKELLKEVLNRFYQECENDKADLWFFAAATCNLEKLEEIAKDYDNKLLCQPRDCDSSIIFTLKYGNVSDPNFFHCMDMLLSVGTNKGQSDFHGRTAIDIIYELYEENKTQTEITEKLTVLTSKLLEKGICGELLDKKTKNFLQTLQEENQNLQSQENQSENTETTKSLLFGWIGKAQTQNFLRFKEIREFSNCDNGEYTLLQFACRRSEKMHQVIKFLLENGADPNRVTQLYKVTPLEIAGMRNYEKSVREILKNKNLVITLEIFNNFVKWRSNPIKLKIFEMFLESDQLDPSFTYETTGNTPLHYATRFSHKKSIQKLLQRSPQSLFVENKAGKTVLCMIDVQDLENYFDYCVPLDTYTTDFSSTDYKMLFRFKSLIIKRDGKNDEVGIVSRISKSSHLERLLTHPLIYTFIVLKWFKVIWYYRFILLLQGFLFVALSVCFYRYTDSSQIEFKLCIFFTILNFILKSVLLFGYRFWHFHKFRWLTLYESGEVLLMVTLFGSFSSAECRAFAFIEMSVLFLLTVGYHPKIAKWSVMLKKVFKSFTILMLFFSIIIIAFAAAFHVLFKSGGHKFFQSIEKSIFITYVMITGEFNINEVEFNTTNVGGYILFFFFAIFMALVIVNFWTGVAVTDIGNIEKDAEINASKNVITFLAFAQKRIYSKRWIRKFLPCPFLFAETDTKEYEVDFYVNKKKQFEGRKNFPASVGQNCLEKIKNFHSRRESDVDGKNILLKLQEVMKILSEMRNNRPRSENYSSKNCRQKAKCGNQKQKNEEVKENDED